MFLADEAVPRPSDVYRLSGGCWLSGRDIHLVSAVEESSSLDLVGSGRIDCFKVVRG